MTKMTREWLTAAFRDEPEIDKFAPSASRPHSTDIVIGSSVNVMNGPLTGTSGVVILAELSMSLVRLDEPVVMSDGVPWDRFWFTAQEIEPVS